MRLGVCSGSNTGRQATRRAAAADSALARSGEVIGAMPGRPVERDAGAMLAAVRACRAPAAVGERLRRGEV